FFDADQIPFIHNVQSSHPDLGGDISALSIESSWPLPSDLTPALFSAAASSSVEPGLPINACTILPIEFPMSCNNLEPFNLPRLMSPDSSTRSFTTSSNYDDDREEEDDEEEVDDNSIFEPPSARPSRIARQQWQGQQFITTKSPLGENVHHYIPTNTYASLSNAYSQLGYHPVVLQQQQQQLQQQNFEQMQAYEAHPQQQTKFHEIHAQQQYQQEQNEQQQQQQQQQHSAEIVPLPVQYTTVQQQPHLPCPPTEQNDFFSGLHTLEGTTTQTLKEMILEVPTLATSMTGLEYHSAATDGFMVPPSSIAAPAPVVTIAAGVDSSVATGGLSWVSLSTPPSPSGRLNSMHRKTLSSASVSLAALPLMGMGKGDGTNGSGPSDDAATPKTGTSQAVKDENKKKTKRAYRAKSSRLKLKPASFVCQAEGCGKEFSRQYNLTSHMKTHSEERPFPCGICHLAFARRHDRERHSRLHTGYRPYKCRYCRSGFMRNDALHRHYRECTATNPQPTAEALASSSSSSTSAANVTAAVSSANIPVATFIDTTSMVAPIPGDLSFVDML
ncbi:hypothetical protein BGZ73_008596, partial [Actinomortierella ambigua]